MPKQTDHHWTRGCIENGSSAGQQSSPLPIPCRKPAPCDMTTPLRSRSTTDRLRCESMVPDRRAIRLENGPTTWRRSGCAFLWVRPNQWFGGTASAPQDDRRSSAEGELIAVAETAGARLRAETDQDAAEVRAAGDALIQVAAAAMAAGRSLTEFAHAEAHGGEGIRR